MRQRGGKFPNIVAHHVDVRRCRPLWRRKRIGIKHAADRRAGFGGDASHKPLVGHIFEKHRRNFLGLDLTDDFGDVAGARLGLGRDPFRRDKAETIGRAKIAESIVRRYNLPPPGRNFGNFPLDLGIERVEPGEIGLRIAALGGFSCRVGGDQPIADFRDIDLGIGDRLPCMWVRPDAPFLAHLLRVYALRRSNHWRLGARRLDQTLDPAFETETVHQNESRSAEFFRIRRL